MQRKDRVGRADMALARLRECMPDVLLAGHMHAHEIEGGWRVNSRTNFRASPPGHAAAV
jgi:hypothetical protein